MLLSGEKFENPVIPEWLENALELSYKQKNIDNIKGYQLLVKELLKNG